MRPADAFGTNPLAPEWGSTGSDLIRLGPDERGPNGEMSGADRPGAREISNAVVDQQGADLPNAVGASDFLWMWGQFLDHDLSLSEAGHLVSAPIPVPQGDPDFDPFGTGTAEIPFNRVDPSPTGGIANVITAFMDASMIYGSDAETLAEMRVAGGKLAMTEESLLKFEGVDVLTGDTRAAENVALMSMHTLFTREHNRMVDELAARDPSLDDDALFEAARARVEALVQAITYSEFLPILLGDDALGDYAGHDPAVNPQVSAEFSTAVFRLGHTLLSSHLQIVAEDGTSEGALALRDAFFRPSYVNENGIESILRGAATQTAQEFDHMIVEDVRSFLFGPPGAGGLDLASLNIQRGRDLGIPSYNGLREAMGLAPVTSFDQISSDPAVAARLAAAYGDVALVDAWVGGLAEDPLPGGMMGETFAAVMVDQFTRVRAGDPFWSEGRGFSQAELDELWSTRLSDIIARNSAIDDVQTDVFKAMTRMAGSDGDDTMHGGAKADFMLGGAGDDVIGGFGGDDELRGGGGNDVLHGLAGDDLLMGGVGDDALLGAEGDDTLEGGDGNDLFDGGAGNDAMQGGAGDDQLYGRAGNDLAHGGAGNDLLMGDDGDDTLVGGDGHDGLDGGAGDDDLQGGAGNDHLYGRGGADLARGGEGDDLLIGGDGDDTLLGEDGNDVFDGGAGNDELQGGAGGDHLYGMAGDDLVHGGDGDDLLMGGDGDDTLVGGDGDDLLDGGTGFNVLTGGAGRDGFHIDASGASRAVLTDFDALEDALFLSNVNRAEAGLRIDPGELTLFLDADTEINFQNWDAHEVQYLTNLLG